MKKKYPNNKDYQGVDKAPGEEKGKGEKEEGLASSGCDFVSLQYFALA